MKKGGGLQDVCLKHNPSAAASIELSGSLMHFFSVFDILKKKKSIAHTCSRPPPQGQRLTNTRAACPRPATSVVHAARGT